VNAGRHSLLIVTQSFEVGGLETYIAGQVRVMAAEGWAVHMACGSEPEAEYLPRGLSSVTGGLCFSPQASAAELVATVEALRSIIRERAVTHVHGHPFTSLFPAMLAASLEGVPFLLTLHGPASLSTGYGPFNDFLLAALAMPLANEVIAVSEEVAELAAPYVGNEQLCIQSNAIDFAQFRKSDSPVPEGASWLVVSRLDGVKIHGIRAFANQASALALGGVDIVGDGPGRATLEEWLEQDGVGHAVRFLGARPDVPELMRSSAGVAGMGRVLLEGVACGKPVCVVGYDGVKGLLDLDLFRRAAYANFSGRNLPNVNADDLARQFKFGSADGAQLAEAAMQRHSEEWVWSDFAKRITSLTSNAQSLVRAIYSVLRSEEAVASPVAYLASDDLFYRMGRVLHGTAFFSPAVAANYTLHESRMQALRAEKLQEEARASSVQMLEAIRLEIKEAMAQADARNDRNAEEAKRTFGELQRLGKEIQRLGEQGNQHHDGLTSVVKDLESSIVELAASLQEPGTWRQRISHAVRNLSGRGR